MLGQPRRVGVTRGEALLSLTSDEAGGTLHEHQDTGMSDLKMGTGGASGNQPYTSSSRTVRCGSACRVVWQGRLLPEAPYAD